MARGVLAGRQGSHTAALEDLNKAFQLAEQYGSPWDRWVALKEISFNYRLSGALPEADQAFHRAEKIVQELADRIHDGAIRDVFLSRALQILVD
jgi:hypothetical protein